MNEWRMVARALLGSWPQHVGAWGQEAVAAYVGELGARGITPEQALLAIRSCPESQTFPPSVAQLAGLARRDPEAPTFAEVLEAIYGPDGVLRPTTSLARDRRTRIAACERGCEDGWLLDEETNTATPCECRGVSVKVTPELRLARADRAHPLIGVFVRRQGLARLERLDLEGEYGELDRKRLKDEWEEFCEREDGRDIRELVARADHPRGRLIPFDPTAMLERRAAS